MGSWHIAIVETEYRKGVPRDRDLVLDVVTSSEDVFRVVERALAEVMRREIADRETERAAAAVEP